MTTLSRLQLLNALRLLLQRSCSALQQSVNSAMVLTYWQIGQLIVKDEQQGEMRASNDQQVLKALAATLTTNFGKGFSKGFYLTNLRKMRTFYVGLPIRDALRLVLS